VNAIALYLLLATLDETDCGQDQESAGQRCEPNIAEVVSQQDKYRHHAETKPPRQAAQLFADTHGLVSTKVNALNM
jgi:hypothetical protein